MEKVFVDTDYRSTLCSTCQEVCHENCSLEPLADGVPSFSCILSRS